MYIYIYMSVKVWEGLTNWRAGLAVFIPIYARLVLRVVEGNLQVLLRRSGELAAACVCA